MYQPHGDAPRGMSQLDLAKYGLSHLEKKEICRWPDADIDKLIDAFVAENIAPAVLGIPFTPYGVKPVLGLSHCRRCGKCCQTNPLDPEHPGVMVYEQDLRRIAQYTKRSYAKLRKRARQNTDPKLPQRRHLPLPCEFYEKGNCRIYKVRPLVCCTYPVGDVSEDIGIVINLRCEYGVEIYKTILEYQREGKEDRLL